MYNNRIDIGNCIDLMNNISDNTFDFCITSPPYNNKSNRIKNCKDKIVKKGIFYGEYEDTLTDSQYEEFLIKTINSLLRVTKYYTFFNIMYNTDNKEILWRLMGAFNQNIKDILIWRKPYQPAMCSNVLTHNYEFILVLSKERENRKYNIDFGRKGEYQTCFDEINNNITNKERFGYKGNFAIMPIQLARRIISSFTKENDLIFDPFMGAGTTAVAAKQLKRNYYGIELIPATAKIAIERIENTASLL